MRISFHPQVSREVRRAVSYYDDVGGRPLGDAFHAEVLTRIDQAIANPKRFHFQEGDIRRANLKRFPYHFLYRESFFGIRVLVLRHDKQNPKFGMRRK